MKLLGLFCSTILGINLFANDINIIEKDIKFLYTQKTNKCVEQSKKDFEKIENKIKNNLIVVSNQYTSDKERNGVITTMVEDGFILVFTNDKIICNELKNELGKI